MLESPMQASQGGDAMETVPHALPVRCGAGCGGPAATVLGPRWPRRMMRRVFSSQRTEQRLRLLEVGGVTALGEPEVDGCQQLPAMEGGPCGRDV